MAKPSVQVYADQELLDAMEQIADEKDWSVSHTWRRAAAEFMQKHLEEYGNEDNTEGAKQ